MQKVKKQTHSRFKISINPNEELIDLYMMKSLWSICTVLKVKTLDSSLWGIIWKMNESSMKLSFGGKTIVFGDEFRQISIASQQDVVKKLPKSYEVFGKHEICLYWIYWRCMKIEEFL